MQQFYSLQISWTLKATGMVEINICDHLPVSSIVFSSVGKKKFHPTASFESDIQATFYNIVLFAGHTVFLRMNDFKHCVN